MSVYDELCGFALAHRSCGQTQAHLDPATDWRYHVRLTCSCGTELRRSVTRKDAHEGLLHTPGAVRRRQTRHGRVGSTAHRSSAA